MFYLLQSVFAVCASNIRWQWTPNGYLAGLIGVLLARGVTPLVSAPFWRRLRRVPRD
jgi:hypothetical protein